MARLLTEVLEPAVGGLDTDTSPGVLGRGYAPTHENLLVDRPGVLPIRGPIQNHSELAIGDNELLTGAWVFNDKILVGIVEKNATAVREPWTAPYRKATAPAELANPETTMKLVDLEMLTVDNVATDVDLIIGGKGARIGDYVYGYAYGADTAANPAELVNGGYQYNRRLLRWDGTNAPPTEYVNAPERGQDVEVHLNRLWVLEGNNLHFSDQDGPTADTAAMWQDDATGLDNLIVVDSDDANDSGVALARVGQNLVIFKRRSIHVLYGYNAATFTLRTFTREVGCIDARSIVEYEDSVYFLSSEGYMRFDGSGLTALSETLHSSLGAAAHNTVGVGGTDGGYAVATKLPNDYILLSIAARNFVTGAIEDEDSFCALLHTPTGRWTRFSSAALANSIPVALGRTPNHGYLIDGDKAVRADRLTTPETVAESRRGYDEVTVAGVSVKARIPAKWWSRFLSLSSDTSMSQLHRILIDHIFQVDAAADGAADGWFVTAYAGNGARLVEEEYQLPSMGDPSGFPYRRRHAKDAFREASDLQLRIEWRDDDSATYPALAKAELHGALIEFQPSRQRDSA